MTALAYPFELAPDDARFAVRFPDVPEAHTFGDTEADAEASAVDCLVAALSFYVEDGQPLPRPSAVQRGQRLAVVPPLVAAKLALHEAMVVDGVTQAALAGRLGVDRKIVRRLLDLDHRSHINEVERALRLLGRRLVVSIAAA